MSWPMIPLGEAVTFKGGGTPSRDVSAYWNGSIPWATVKDLNTGYTIRSTQESITAEGLQRSASNLIPAGTVIIPTRMALGKAVISEVDVAINQDLKAVLPKTSIDSRFLMWFFVVNGSKIEAMGKGATVKGVTLDQLERLQFPLPPLTEQRRIAAILDKADALRAKRREAIAKLDQLLQSVFLDMFGDPVTNPKGWPKAKLGELVNFTGGSQPEKKHFIDHPAPGYVRLVQIRDFRTDKYPTYVPEALTKRRFLKSDVMIGRYGPPVFQIFRGLEGSYNVALMKAEPLGQIIGEYLFYLLSSSSIQTLVIANSQRSAGQSGVNLDFLEEIQLGAPPLDLQRRFARLSEQIERSRIPCEKQIEKIERMFRALQSHAFGGSL